MMCAGAQVVEDCEGRLSEQQVNKLQEIVDQTLPEAPATETAENEANDE
jgi:hypothetical protein